MDYADEATFEAKVPEGAFEAELYRRQIEAEFGRVIADAAGVVVAVGDGPDADGRYDLCIYEPHSGDDWMRIASFVGEIRGKAWLAERLSPATESYRISLWYEIEREGEDNALYRDCAPLLPWRYQKAFGKGE